jgi:uncharacterized protein YkwD
MIPGTLHRHRRSSSVAILVVALLLTAMPQTTVVAYADSGMEAAFVAAVNRERAAAGLGSLSVADDMTSVARSHSRVMANGTDLHHNPDLGRDVSGWKKVGENVGRGPSVDAIHAALMASPGHERNIVDPEWTQLGMGVVVEEGRIWVTQVFRTPSGATTAPAPRPASAPAAPEPETRPAPSPEPEPRQVIETPIALDRITLTLAKLEAAERSTTLDDVLG